MIAITIILLIAIAVSGLLALRAEVKAALVFASATDLIAYHAAGAINRRNAAF